MAQLKFQVGACRREESGGSGICDRERELRWHPLGSHSRAVELVIKAEGGLMGEAQIGDGGRKIMT